LFPDFIKIKFKIDFKLLKIILTYGAPLLIAGFAGIVNEAADRILLKKFLSGDINIMHEIGVYGACYKLSIAIVIFLQAYKLAVEPMIFDKENMSKTIYAKMLNYFVIAGTIIVLTILLYIDYFKFFIGQNFHEGLTVVPILLFANLFFGIYYSLSVWYKITDKTKYGAIFSILGAIITIVLNIIFIPLYGYEASAWATFICFGMMAILSYIIGQKHYKIPYNIYKIIFYLILSFLFYRVSLIEGLLISPGAIKIILLFTYIVIVSIVEKKYFKYEN
jgi:O-antigen/teichoic acid export membrane protein